MLVERKPSSWKTIYMAYVSFVNSGTLSHRTLILLLYSVEEGQYRLRSADFQQHITSDIFPMRWERRTLSTTKKSAERDPTPQQNYPEGGLLWARAQSGDLTALGCWWHTYSPRNSHNCAVDRERLRLLPGTSKTPPSNLAVGETSKIIH